VEYWEELCRIMEWSRTHVHSTFHIILTRHRLARLWFGWSGLCTGNSPSVEPPLVKLPARSPDPKPLGEQTKCR